MSGGGCDRGWRGRTGGGVGEVKGWRCVRGGRMEVCEEREGGPCGLEVQRAGRVGYM